MDDHDAGVAVRRLSLAWGGRGGGDPFIKTIKRISKEPILLVRSIVLRPPGHRLRRGHPPTVGQNSESRALSPLFILAFRSKPINTLRVLPFYYSRMVGTPALDPWPQGSRTHGDQII